MISPKHLVEYVIKPVLEGMDIGGIPYSIEAVHLLVMTAAHESAMGKYLQQVRGPAQGIYQMEPATERDIYENYLRFFKNFQVAIQQYTLGIPNELQGNLYYATAMARLHYYRVPEALPKIKDFDDHYSYATALGEYAKKYYNTELGKATVNMYVNALYTHYSPELRADFEQYKEDT